MPPVFGWLAAVGLVVCAVVLLAQGSLIPSEGGTNMFQPVTLKLHSFKNCPEYIDMPNTYADLALYMDPENEHTLFVDGVLNIREEIPDGTKMIIDIRRCFNEREESCEKYVSLDVEDICWYMPQENQMWTEFFNHIEGLSKICPIPAGSYKMNEAPFDLSSFQNQTEFLGHWQAEISYSNDNKRTGCLLLDATLSLRNSAARNVPISGR